jgi:hypothetical protein
MEPALKIIPPPLQIIQKKELTPKQLLAAQMSSDCATNADIIAKVKCNFKTLKSWKNMPEFKEKVVFFTGQINEAVQQRKISLQLLALESCRMALTQRPGSQASLVAARMILDGQPTNQPKVSSGPIKVKFGGLRRVESLNKEDEE